MNTDWTEFGGTGVSNGQAIATDDIPMHGFEQSAALTLPPLSVMYFKCTRKKPKIKPRVKKEAAEGEEKPKRTRKKAAASEAGAEKPTKKTRAKSTGKTAAKKSEESTDE